MYRAHSVVVSNMINLPIFLSNHDIRKPVFYCENQKPQFSYLNRYETSLYRVNSLISRYSNKLKTGIFPYIDSDRSIDRY